MNGAIIISICSILISLGAFINAFSFPGGTNDGVPGAGAFPQAVCVVIILINIILIVRELKAGRNTEPMSPERKTGLVRFGLMVAATAAFLLLWNTPVHFIILCSLYLIAVGAIMKQNLKLFIPGAIVSSFLIFFIFQRVLNVMLSV